jgi:hypothetical protein
MLERLKQSMNIEKGYKIWKQEGGIDLKKMVKNVPFTDGAAYREGLRDMGLSMGFEQHDTATMMICPFLDFFEYPTKRRVARLVVCWYGSGKIQPDVLNFFKEKLNDDSLFE